MLQSKRRIEIINRSYTDASVRVPTKRKYTNGSWGHEPGFCKSPRLYTLIWGSHISLSEKQTNFIFYCFNFGILVGVSVPFTMVVALFAMALIVDKIFSTSNVLYSSLTVWYNLSISILSVLIV